MTDVEMLKLPEIVRRSATSDSTVRRAWAKWKSGLDDGQFPPPLEFQRKGNGARAEKVSSTRHFEDWLERWPAS